MQAVKFKEMRRGRYTALDLIDVHDI